MNDINGRRTTGSRTALRLANYCLIAALLATLGLELVYPRMNVLLLLELPLAGPLYWFDWA